MASAHIEVSGSASRYAGDVRGFVDSLQRVVDAADKVKAVGDQIALDGDWAALALALGTTQAEAEAVYNLTGSVNGELHAVFITQLLGRLG